MNERPLIVVLGSSGLVGSAVVKTLARRPVRLRLVGRRPTTCPADARADIEVRTCDLTAQGAIAEAIRSADAVIHLVAHIAGENTWRVSSADPMAERVHVGLMNDILDAIRIEKRSSPPTVLMAGSASQVGKYTTARINGGEVDQPLTTYDRQKSDAERALLVASRDGVVRGACLRLATLYGRDTQSSALDRGVVSSMMRRAYSDLPLTMWGDGSVKRDVLCVDDAASAFIAALDSINSVAGRHWIVGTGTATTLADLFRAISDCVAAQSGREAVPLQSVSPGERSAPTDGLDFVLDPTPFQELSGWLPRVPLNEGLEQLAAAMFLERMSSEPHRGQ